MPANVHNVFINIKCLFWLLSTYYSKCRITLNFRLLWAGLWLLIMLQFTNVVATSVSILNCPMLNDFDGRNSLVRMYTKYHISIVRI